MQWRFLLLSCLLDHLVVRMSIIDGIVRPSALAVFRLITSSNFVARRKGDRLLFLFDPCREIVIKPACAENTPRSTSRQCLPRDQPWQRSSHCILQKSVYEQKPGLHK